MEQRGLLRSIHGLRAVAALLVVFHHSREQIDAFAIRWPTDLGAGGVDIFFVISGLVMILATSERPMTRGVFLAHRIRRIMPLYWFVTLLTAAIVIVAPSLMKNTSFSAISLVKSLLFIPHYNVDKGDLSPLVKLGWTLNFEMLFYVLFAFFLPLRPLKRLAAVGAALAVLIALALIFKPTVAPLRFWGSLITLEFVAGMGIGVALTGGAFAKVSPRAAFALLALGVIGFVALADVAADRLFVHGIPAALIVLGLAIAEARGYALLGGKASAFLGNASYAIYLGHLFAVRAAGVFWAKANLPTNGVAWMIGFILLAVTGGTIVGILLHVLVERPLAGLIRRGVPGTRPRRAAGDYVTPDGAPAEGA